MNLRVLGIVAASAASLAFAASAAAAAPADDRPQAYPPAEYCDITASPTSLPVGGKTTVTLTDAPNTAATLKVSSASASAGQTLVRTTDAQGKATFVVTLKAAGTYSLDASMATGEVCALSVTAVPASDDPDEGVLGASDEVSDATTLALTGANPVGYLAAAIGLAGVGVAGVTLSRRRRQH